MTQYFVFIDFKREKIGNRTVLIDANLPIQLAESLRKKWLQVRHVCEINTKTSDSHIHEIVWPIDVSLMRDSSLYWKLVEVNQYFSV
jgi:hypothetical protein